MPVDNILIIQENPRERMQIAESLENLGFHVNSVMDGFQAESACLKNDYKMIIADFGTPQFSGIDFLKKVKKKSHGTELLFVSENPVVEDAVDLMRCGAFDFIVKPLDKEQLELCVQKVFAKTGSKVQEKDHSFLSRKCRSFLQKKPVEIITKDSGMHTLLKMAARVANSSASVLIQGESGTGKELFARYIHEKSNRKDMPFVAVNCAALPEALLESELFGHEKGAFTGAVSKKPGKFELADNGTLFLDEITEMQLHLQAKLLRVLQENVVDRVGGTYPVDVDVRIVATTNRDVKEAMEKGDFRQDLYYRLNTIPIVIPPLRSRPGDLELLSKYFIKKYNIIDARNVKALTKEAFDFLSSQKFEGNVRELENIIHRAVLLADKENIEPEDLLMDGIPANKESLPDHEASSCNMEPGSLRKMEEKMIFHTLDSTEGNRTHAAKILGISVRTLRNKLNEYKQGGRS
ncbi:MAG: sigma-54 dependent transcriptional regulator [Thermodesulfobacteriota bacterium]|nr:sigma-54 dependent transcriptional regulator [Thermodesulfobacteriota bacterium]